MPDVALLAYGFVISLLFPMFAYHPFLAAFDAARCCKLAINKYMIVSCEAMVCVVRHLFVYIAILHFFSPQRRLEKERRARKAASATWLAPRHQILLSPSHIEAESRSSTENPAEMVTQPAKSLFVACIFESQTLWKLVAWITGLCN